MYNMKLKTMIILALLATGTAWGQPSKVKPGQGKPSKPVIMARPARTETHGTEVRQVAKQNQDGRAVSEVASSKSRGHHWTIKDRKSKRKNSGKIKRDRTERQAENQTGDRVRNERGDRIESQRGDRIKNERRDRAKGEREDRSNKNNQ